MGFREPTQLLCPRPFTHRFPNPPAEGPDFTFARLAFDVGPRNPLAQALPCLIALPLARVHGLHSTLELLFAETDRVRCGQRLLVDRLLDVAVIQLLRWLLDHPPAAGVRPGLINWISEPSLALAMEPTTDRKSVVEGKGGSVRVRSR